MYLPRYHHNEVHDVPGISEVGVWMHHETHCNYLRAHLNGKNAHEVRFEFLLNIAIVNDVDA